MASYKVKAQAFYRVSGRAIGRPRCEIIDTRANPLFHKCKSILDVKIAYESFWNELNPLSEEVVFVQHIDRMSMEGDRA